METKVISPLESNIDIAAELLKNGELVAIPTETVYGLAANALSNEAVSKIFTAKGRPQDNPLISHISSLDMLPLLTSSFSETAQKLAEKFWPGPLTIILPRGEKVCDAVCAGLTTTAVRMPSHPVALQIIAKAGVPLAAPSANLSGSPSPTTAQDVFSDLNGKIPLIIDGGSCDVGVESTVISLVEETPVLLRPGAITKEDIEKALGTQILIANAVLNPTQQNEKVLSPGMKYKHYAPKATLILVNGTTKQYCDYVNEKAKSNESVMALCFTGEQANLQCKAVTFGDKDNSPEQAKQIFSALRELDKKGATTAYAHCPSTNGVALAVYNRMLRAAAFQVVEL